MFSMEMFWVAVIAVSVLTEICTVGLTAIWLSGGGLAALLVALVGGPLELQIAAFFAVTLALLFWTRPLAVKYLNKNRMRTNVDATLGQSVRVLERIDNAADTGKVVYRGMEWTARAAKGAEVFEAGETAVVHAIEGVKMLVVRPEGSNAPNQPGSPEPSNDPEQSNAPEQSDGSEQETA